jgi:hypothetical protein
MTTNRELKEMRKLMSDLFRRDEATRKRRTKKTAKERVLAILLGIHDSVSPSARAKKKRSREHTLALLNQLHEMPEQSLKSI